MKRYFRIGATVLLLLTMMATVAGCAWLCIPPPGTDTSDIGWKLGVALWPPTAGLLLVWEASLYGCVMYFLTSREKWNFPLTVFISLLTIALVFFFLAVFVSPFCPPLNDLVRSLL